MFEVELETIEQFVAHEPCEENMDSTRFETRMSSDPSISSPINP